MTQIKASEKQCTALKWYQRGILTFSVTTLTTSVTYVACCSPDDMKAEKHSHFISQNKSEMRRSAVRRRCFGCGEKPPVKQSSFVGECAPLSYFGETTWHVGAKGSCNKERRAKRVASGDRGVLTHTKTHKHMHTHTLVTRAETFHLPVCGIFSKACWNWSAQFWTEVKK